MQNEADADSLSMDGFSNLEILTETTEFCHLSIRKTPAFYKVNGISTMDQKGCGVLISHPVLNSAYLTGESSWYDGMKQVLKTWKPRLVVVSRRELKQYVEQQRMESSVWFPKDGEEYRL